MAKSNEDRCNRQRCMDAGELAPLVTEFTCHLSELGHTSLTVSGYDAAARHLAQWLVLVKVAVADIDGAVIDRFARHRCRCPGGSRSKNQPLTPHESIDRAVSHIVVEPNRLLLTPTDPTDNPSPIAIPWSPKERNGAYVDEAGAPAANCIPNPHLVQALARADTWHKLLCENRYASIEDLAKAVNLNPKVIRSVIRLAFLPPAATRMILRGDQPAGLTVTKLANSITLNWTEIAS